MSRCRLTRTISARQRRAGDKARPTRDTPRPRGAFVAFVARDKGCDVWEWTSYCRTTLEHTSLVLF